jgi:hypothetical protein
MEVPRNPWAESPYVTGVSDLGEGWKEYAVSQRFTYWTWRQKWSAIWSILRRGRILFRLSVTFKGQEGRIWVDEARVEQVNPNAK